MSEPSVGRVWQPGEEDLVGMARAEFAFPGPERDERVAAVLSGRKRTSTTLRREYDIEDDPLPVVGRREKVIDSWGRVVAVIEFTDVHLSRLGDVALAHCLDEALGVGSVQEWRARHEGLWHTSRYRAWLGDADFTADDDTEVVLVRYVVTAAFDPPVDE